ncbi:MAG TPA: hypothetical protein VH257_04285 [Chloroflexota bacterium]|jgi:hypothetical protein|nr:hypothetical protein [Chloroflexota bacterium]
MDGRDSRVRTLPAALLAALLSLAVLGCGVSVRTDRGAIGGGPEQATAQAQARVRATAVAVATANPQLVSTGQPCDCETGK